jgi:hypothetical protein
VRVTCRRLWILACALALVVGLAACGQTSKPSSELNNGVYVDAGPITYQLQISRELNQYAIEDRQYLAGLPAGDGTLGADQLWYGVFLWAKNQSNEPQLTAKTVNFNIVDSSNHHYYPVAVNAELNAYAWTQQELLPGNTMPIPNTTAYYGPAGGNLLLFKLPTKVYSNRPLTLEISPQGSSTPSPISLDL